MGPIALFDKSFLQSLSLDESTWFDHFFYPNICPLFYVETLADLSKSSNSSGRSGEDEVRIIADKTPTLSGGPCVHHRELCFANLMGHRIPMNGQIPIAGGRRVKAADGRRGIVFDATPEAQAFSRWQKAEFREIEFMFAAGWRHMLTGLNLPAVAERMRKLGINPKDCTSIEMAHAIASALVRKRDSPFDQMALLFAFVEIPPEQQRSILERWAIDKYRPLAEYAPYAAHVLVVELFFQIALGANLISADRPSNRVDIAYLCYLPFSMIFVSSDKLHRRCANVFLRKDQQFVWGPDLKSELKRVDRDFSRLSTEVLEQGLMKFAKAPTGDPSDLLIALWDRHTPGWRKRDEISTPELGDKQKKLVQHLRELTDAPTDTSQLEGADEGLDGMSIERMVPKKKGSWWLLPKDLQLPDDKRGKQA